MVKRVGLDENERMTEGQDEGASEMESGTKLSTTKNYRGLDSYTTLITLCTCTYDMYATLSSYHQGGTHFCRQQSCVVSPSLCAPPSADGFVCISTCTSCTYILPTCILTLTPSYGVLT